MKPKQNMPTGIFLCITLSLFLCVLISAPVFSIEGQEIHVLLIILGVDENIRLSVEANELNITRQLKSVSQHCRIHLTVMKSDSETTGVVTTSILFQGHQTESGKQAQRVIRAEQVKRWVRDLRPGNKDTVCIYYSGPKAVAPDTHYLKFNSEYADNEPESDLLERWELRTLLQEKAARLKMLITDTCQVIADSTGETHTYTGELSVLKELFLQHTGLLDIAATDPETGRFAAGDDRGGYFTATLVESFTPERDNNVDGFLAWEEVFDVCKTRTQRRFRQATFSDQANQNFAKIGQTDQTPVAHSLPTQTSIASPPAEPPSILPKAIATLHITSHPRRAQVYINGTNTGEKTPLLNHKIHIGRVEEKQVSVEVRYPGYTSRSKTFTLRGDDSIPWDVTLEKVVVQRSRPLLPNTTRMVLIPAGEFEMGTERIKGGESEPIHTVYLNNFYIDTHEVTVGQYRAFIEASGHKRPPWKQISTISPTDDHPIVGVSWHDAMAYAVWAGKRLPTEAEWEKAARGGLTDMDYPWGDEEISSERANFGKHHGKTTPVRSYGANAFGLYDMAGNVSEWCLDPWDKDFYAHSPLQNPFAGNKSQGETITDYESVLELRVIRGGSYLQGPVVCEVGARLDEPSKGKFVNIGFRCVRDAP